MNITYKNIHQKVSELKNIMLLTNSIEKKSLVTYENRKPLNHIRPFVQNVTKEKKLV